MKMNEWMRGQAASEYFMDLAAFTSCEHVPSERALKLARDFVKRHVRKPHHAAQEYPFWALDTETVGAIIIGRRDDDVRLSGAVAWALAEAGFKLLPLNAWAAMVQVDLVNMNAPSSVQFWDVTDPRASPRAQTRAEVTAILDGRRKYIRAARPATYFRPDRP